MDNKNNGLDLSNGLACNSNERDIKQSEPESNQTKRYQTNSLDPSFTNPLGSGPQLDMPLPDVFSVAVILESRPAKSVWIDRVWKAVAITVVGARETADIADGGKGQSVGQTAENPRLIQTYGNITHHLFSGLRVTLYKDQCESYYHNLIAPTPRCYVVAHLDDIEATPEPFLITMSFDEAHAYLEGDDEIYEVDVPPELYRWTEVFLLLHYAPEKKFKRKRKSWTQQDSEQTTI